MQIIQQPQLDFCHVMMKPKRSSLTSRADVSLVREFKGKWNPENTFKCVPICAANMDNITTVKMAQVLTDNQMMITMGKFTSTEEWNELYNTCLPESLVIPSIGIRSVEEYKFYKTLCKKQFPNILVVDVPNGYTERFLHFISDIREKHPEVFIIAGNVVSAEQVEELIVRGADCVKVGIGSGSVCSTRIKSGVGRPQGLHTEPAPLILPA